MVAVLTLVDLLRYRDKLRLNIAVMLGSLATAILVSQFSNLIGPESFWLENLGVMAIVAHPYLLLRLVYHIRPISRPVRWMGFGGLVIFWSIRHGSKETFPSLQFEQ